MNDDLLNGAITGALDPDSKEALKHAENYYEAVRGMKTDYKKIANNTGWDEKLILTIKNHIFMNNHDLGRREPCRFDPDYFMAQSWQRLINGKDIEEMDYVLLEHELMESNLMDKMGMSYIEAHETTNQTYNYSKFLR